MLSFRAPRTTADDAATFESSSVAEDEMADTGSEPNPPDGVKTPSAPSVATTRPVAPSVHVKGGDVRLPHATLLSAVHALLSANAEGGIMCVATCR